MPAPHQLDPAAPENNPDPIRKRARGANNTYSDEQLAIFGRYVAQRAAVAPLECNGGTVCWVWLGPPGVKSAAANRASLVCLGCGGTVPRPRSNCGRPPGRFKP